MGKTFIIKRRYLYVGVVLAILAIGGFLSLNNNDVNNPVQNTSTPIVLGMKTAVNGQEEKLYPAKELTLQTTTGEVITLSQFKGNVVILQTMASWCPSCKLQAKQIKPVYNKYKDKGLVAISIDIQPERSSLDSLKNFKKTYGGDWYFGFYPEFILQYEILSLDSTIIIDKEGHIAYRDHIVTSSKQIEDEVVRLLEV